ncbi:TonB-dependent receptor domain-containing protein [Roseibium sp.]|uniref:TonB-dependent receptor domain-containing protein n=1 Tax=Roseibium sp. TaxID=1936156 RepID=UPI003A9840CB
MNTHALRTMLLAGTVLSSLVVVAPVLAQETELSSVVVNTDSADVATDTAAAVSEIDAEEIEVKQAGSFAELLASVPGVSVAGSSNPAGQAINIRGFGSQGGTYGSDQRVAVSVDGVSAGSDEAYRLGSLSFIEPDLLKNVKVYRGPAGTGLFSSGAIGGAVIAETKDASDLLEGDDRFMARQKLEYSSNGDGLLSSSYVAAQPLENLELLGAFSYRYSDVHVDGDGNDIDGSDFGTPFGLLSGKYTFGDTKAHSIKASYQYGEAKLTNVPYSALVPSFTMFGFVDRDVVENKANLEYGYNPSDNDLVDFKLSVGYRKQEIEQSNSSIPMFASTTEVDFDNEFYTVRAENTSRLETGAFAHSLIYGVDGSIYDRIASYNGNSSSSNPDGRSTKLAAFAQDKIEFGRLTLTPTVRFEFQKIEPLNGTTGGYGAESTNFAISPSFEAVYALTDHLNVFGSVAYTDRLPTVDELYNTSVTTELEPETAMNYEAGVSYDHRSFITDGDVFQAKLSVYQNNIENMIDGPTQADEAKVEGFEVEARYDAERFYTMFSYSQIRGYDLSNQYGSSGWLPYVPADEARWTVGTRFPTWNLDVSWEAVFNAGQDRVSSLSETGGYAIHNFKTVWKPEDGLLQGTDVVFGVENVFDRTYTNYLSQENGDGRTFKLTVAKTF